MYVSTHWITASSLSITLYQPKSMKALTGIQIKATPKPVSEPYLAYGECGLEEITLSCVLVSALQKQ
jgi:hypothetical protein